MSAPFDLRSLPRFGTGRRSTIVWGVVLLIVIEGVVVLSMITSYFYLAVVRGGAFPHEAGSPPDPTKSAVALGLSAAGALLAHGAERSARYGRMHLARLALALATLSGSGYVVLSVLDLADRDYTHASHAYGSITWTLSGYQAVHLVALIAATAAMVGFSFSHAFGGEKRAPMQALAYYWDFVFLAGASVFFTIYITPYLI